MRVDLSTLDRMRLVGDEDCGVGLDCRDCDRGGLPIAYYAHPDDRSYLGQDVVRVHTIGELVLAGIAHRTAEHGDTHSLDGREATERATEGEAHG